MKTFRNRVFRQAVSTVPADEVQPSGRVSLASRIRSRRSKTLAGLALAAMVVVVPGTAYAEGSFLSSLSGIRSGFHSRIWTDTGRDANATALRIAGCSRTDGARFLLKAELFRVGSFWDTSLGVRDVSGCVVAPVSVNWGNPGPGDYYIVFTHYDFGNVNANSLTVSY